MSDATILRLTLDAKSKARVGSTALSSARNNLLAPSLGLIWFSPWLLSVRLRFPIVIKVSLDLTQLTSCCSKVLRFLGLSDGPWSLKNKMFAGIIDVNSADS